MIVGVDRITPSHGKVDRGVDVASDGDHRWASAPSSRGADRLDLGDVVLLYSDGIIERPGRELAASTVELARVAGPSTPSSPCATPASAFPIVQPEPHPRAQASGSR
jgi:hypothetical protein